MNAKIGLLALLLVMVLICPATVMGSEMTALDAAGAGATVVASAPVIELVSVDPDVVTVTLLNLGTETRTFDLMPEGGCSDWINVYNEDDPTTPITDVTIDSNKKARLIVKCAIPEDVANGEYLAIVSVHSKTKDKGETAQGVAGQHFTVHVTVKGKQNLAARVGNITISATEVGMPVETLIEFKNVGKVIARPGISISMIKNSTLVWCFGKAETGVTPGYNSTITVLSDTAGMEPGEYPAIVVVSLDKETLATVELPFTLFDSGTITKEGELNSLSLDGVPQINSSINIVAEFENTGMIALMAKFIGAIYGNGKFEVALDSEEELVAVGETTELTADYKITAPGDYKTKGYVTYSGKEIQKEEVSFTVSGVDAKEVAKVEKKGIPGFEFVTCRIAIAILFLLVSVYRRERGRRR